jgi:hypothetical protein
VAATVEVGPVGELASQSVAIAEDLHQAVNMPVDVPKMCVAARSNRRSSRLPQTGRCVARRTPCRVAIAARAGGAWATRPCWS